MDCVCTIKSDLMDIVNLEDVNAALLFRIDGNVIRSCFKSEYEQTLVHILQWCKANVKKVSGEMKDNNLEKVTYELSNACIIFNLVNDVCLLTTIAKSDVNDTLLSIESKRKSIDIAKKMG